MRRRRFIQAGLAGCAGLVLGAGRAGAAAKASVYRVRDGGVFADDAALDQPTVRAMLRKLITSLARNPSVPAAWRTFVSPGDVVGIKVDAVNGPLTAYNRQVVLGVAEELLGIGIPAGRIIIFDRSGMDLRRGGYTVVTTGDDVRCYGADEAGYEELPVTLDGVDARLTRIITRTCTALINMPVLRAHSSAGMSFAVANMMNAVEDPAALLPAGAYRAADLYAVPAVADKVRLVIGDCLRPIYRDGSGDPAAYRRTENTLLAGLDPVAVDAAGAALLAGIRNKTMKPHRPLPTVKTTSRAAALGLGTPAYRMVAADEGSGT